MTLYDAARIGDCARVTALLAAGVSVESVTNGRRPLQIAVFHNQIEVVTALLAAGADPNSRDCDNWYPLHYAAHLGYNVVTAALLASGAVVNSVGGKGWHPL